MWNDTQVIPVRTEQNNTFISPKYTTYIIRATEWITAGSKQHNCMFCTLKTAEVVYHFLL